MLVDFLLQVKTLASGCPAWTTDEVAAVRRQRCRLAAPHPPSQAIQRMVYDFYVLPASWF